jgi:HSP20 family protein
MRRIYREEADPVSLRSWDPYVDFTTLRDNINRLIEDTWRVGDRPTEMASSTWPVPVDIYETKDAIVLRVEAPGINPKDVKISLVGEQLTISGKRQQEAKVEGRQYVRVERRYGSFLRSFTVNVPVKADQIKATYRDGVLEVSLPKADEVRPREIEVTVE